MEDFRWKKESLKINVDGSYDRALDISTSLPAGILRRFEADGENMKPILLDWIGEWLEAVRKESRHSDEIGYNLHTLCWYVITMRNDNNEDVITSRKFLYDKKRRDSKRYSLSKCTKEKESGWSDPNGLAKADCDRYFSLLASHQDEMKAYSTKSEYLESRFKAVKNWAKDKNSDLSEFPFFSLLDNEKKAWNFMVDLAYNCYAGYDSQPLTQQPENTIRFGMFSGRPQETELHINSSERGYELLDKHTVDGDDGAKFELTTVVDTVTDNSIDFSDGVSNISLRSNLLEPKDRDIFSLIYSSFSVSDVNRGTRSFRLSEIVKKCYKRPRKECYLDVIERLNKLCIYRMEYVTKDVEGKVTEAGNLHFFDSRYHFPQEGQAEKTVMTTNITSSTKASFIDEIRDYDLKNVTIEVMPSVTMQDSVRKKTNVAIYTDQYMKLPSDKCKSIAMYLQMYRSKIYPEVFVMIPFKQVVQAHRLEKLRVSGQLKEIRAMIDEILEAQRADSEEKLRLIESYTCDKEYLKVNFIPFTEEECRRYGVRTALKDDGVV